MIRVLIADHALALDALRLAVSSGQHLVIVGEAKSAAEITRLNKAHKPDLLVIGLHLGGRQGGGKAAREIMSTSPKPIVLYTTSAAEATDPRQIAAASACGCVALLHLPTAMVAAGRAPRGELDPFVSALTAMADVKVVRLWRPADKAVEVVASPVLTGTARRVVALGASTGGPPALQTILAGLASDFALPILVVQHIVQGFTRGLVDWLNDTTHVAVRLAISGVHPAPRHVYLAPDDWHLGLSGDGSLKLSREVPRRGFRPSCDYLFQSVAEHCGSGSLAVVLTGMGNDGVEGIRYVHATGGKIIAQDQASSVVFGMPAAAIATDLVDKILPLDEIAPHVSAWANGRIGGSNHQHQLMKSP